MNWNFSIDIRHSCRPNPNITFKSFLCLLNRTYSLRSQCLLCVRMCVLVWWWRGCNSTEKTNNMENFHLNDELANGKEQEKKNLIFLILKENVFCCILLWISFHSFHLSCSYVLLVKKKFIFQKTLILSTLAHIDKVNFSFYFGKFPYVNFHVRHRRSCSCCRLFHSVLFGNSLHDESTNNAHMASSSCVAFVTWNTMMK